MRLLLLSLVAAYIMFADGVAGTYKGTYSGSAGASGDIKVALKQASDGAWKSEVTFSFGGGEIKTKVTSVSVEGSKVKIVYEFDLDGNSLESTLKGELKGTTLAGDYHTKSTADGSPVDEGTWTGTAQ